MSGPVRPPLTVTTASGTPSGRPITTIKVSDGDLTVSGNVATIDTSGSGGTPGGSTTEVQYNNAGAFAGDAGFFIATAGGGDTTKVRIGGLIVGNSRICPRSGNDSLNLHSDGSGEIHLRSSTDSGTGTTWTDSVVAIISNTNSDEAYLKFRSQTTTDDGGLLVDGNQDLILISKVTNKDIDLQVNGTGQVEVQNTTTDNDTTLSVKGNGAGDSIINLNNPTKSVQLRCDTNQKLKVQGGLNTFIFDASSATGGITWPDGTEQITAATGASFPLLAPDGSAAAPSYSFADDTDTGIFRTGAANQVIIATGGDGNHIFNTTNMQGPNGSAITPAYSFTEDVDTGFGRWDTNELFFATGSSRRLSIESDGAVDFIDSIIKIGGSLGSDGQVITSTGSGAAWEDAGGGGGVAALIPPWQPKPGETGDASWMPSNPFTTSSAGSSMSLGSAINKPSYYPFFAGDNTKIDALMIKVASDSTDGSTPQIKCAIYTMATITNQIADDTVIGTPIAKVTGSDATFAVDNSVGSERRPYSYGSDVILTANTWYCIGIVGGQAFTSYPGIRRNGNTTLQWSPDVNYGGWTNSGDSDYTFPASYAAGDTNWNTSSAFFYTPSIFFQSPDAQS